MGATIIKIKSLCSLTISIICATHIYSKDQIISKEWCSNIQVSCLITVAALLMILYDLFCAQEENIEERKVEKKVVVDQDLLQVTTNKCLNNLCK